MFIVAAPCGSSRSSVFRFWQRSIVLQALLFAMLCAHATPAGEPANVNLRQQREPVFASRAAARLNEKMDALVAVDFSGTPLQEAIDFVDAVQNLRIQYDAGALGKDGIP